MNRHLGPILVALLMGVALASAACASRRPSLSPWCAVLSDLTQTHCDYETLQQCMDTVSAVGGFCQRNPRLGQSPEPPSGRRRRH
jgi:hypothetical protein